MLIINARFLIKMIPVLKCYFRNEHVWLANGDFVMRHDKDEEHVLACPIVKFTSVPDSKRWAPRSDIDAGQDTADGKNVIVNATMDLLTMHLHPTAVRNKNIVLGDQDVTMRPYQTIDSYGDPNKALAYLPPPQIPSGLLSIVELMAEDNANTVGQPRQLQGAGIAGTMRGGMHGFESFLQQSFARQKLAGAVLEKGPFKKLIQLIIIYEQQRMRSPEMYIVRDPNNETNFIEKRITPTELRHVFAVKVNLGDKFMRSPIERSMDLQIAPALKQDPSYDKKAVDLEYLFGGNRERQRRVLASPEVVEQNIKQLQAQQAAEQQEKTRAQGSNLTDQASAGQQSQAVE